MTGNPAWIIVPVKRFSDAKQRLADIMSPSERRQLARTMLDDVLRGITSSGADFAGIILPTSDDHHDVADVADQYHAITIREPEEATLNGAINFAVQQLPESGDKAIIVVPSDIPHLSGSCLRSVSQLIASPRSAAIVRATVDGGTNLLACRPAELVAPSFGPGSFERHRDLAIRAGVIPSLPAWPMMGQDIDRPDDLQSFLAFQTDTHTHQYLRSLNLPRRFLGNPGFSKRFAATCEPSRQSPGSTQQSRHDL